MTQGTAGLTILSNTVEIGDANLSPFGDLIIAQITPVIQADFVYGINSRLGIETELNSATVDTSVSRLRLQSGTNTAGSAIYTSRRIAKYRPGQGILVRFSAAFTTGVASSTQAVGVGDAEDRYAFGFDGTSFGIQYINNTVEDWIPQASWNGDKCDGTGPTAFDIDPTLGNIYMIKYPYLGYGPVTFWVMDPSGEWLKVHTIEYPNMSTTIQLLHPNMRFWAESTNSGAATNKTIYIGSFGVFTLGPMNAAGSTKWGTYSTKSGVTTETAVFNIRNATTYNGTTNYGILRLTSLSFSTQANAGSAVCRLYLGATTGGSPSYTPISGSTGDNGVTVTSGLSVASVDTAGTYTSGGYMVFDITAANPGTAFADMLDYDIFLGPTEVLTATVTSTNSTVCGVALNWLEDV